MKKGEHLRSCIGCRAVNPKEKLLRFVLSPQGDVALDYNLKLPGRGCYLCPDAKCIIKALKANAFKRALKCQVDAISAEDIVGMVKSKATEKIVSYLIFAKKSGKMAMGTMAVDNEFKRGSLALVVVLSDMSEPSIAAVERKAVKEGILFHVLQYSERIGLVLDNKKVVGIKDPGLSGSIAKEIEIIGNISEC